jgi:hypothetical protein
VISPAAPDRRLIDLAAVQQRLHLHPDVPPQVRPDAGRAQGAVRQVAPRNRSGLGHRHRAASTGRPPRMRAAADAATDIMPRRRLRASKPRIRACTPHAPEIAELVETQRSCGSISGIGALRKARPGHFTGLGWFSPCSGLQTTRVTFKS